jgi:hypothetical protein
MRRNYYCNLTLRMCLLRGPLIAPGSPIYVYIVHIIVYTVRCEQRPDLRRGEKSS